MPQATWPPASPVSVLAEKLGRLIYHSYSDSSFAPLQHEQQSLVKSLKAQHQVYPHTIRPIILSASMSLITFLS